LVARAARCYTVFTMKTLITLAALALIPTSLFAATAMEQLGEAAHFDMKPIVMQVKDLKQAVERPSIPMRPTDVLASCAVIDAKTFRAYDLKEAAGVLNGCLNRLYTSDAGSRRAYTVEAATGRFAVRACPEARAAGTFSCQAFIEVEGLVITIKGTILTGDPILENLNYSLQKRDSKVLGFKATLDNKAAVLK